MTLKTCKKVAVPPESEEIWNEIRSLTSYSLILKNANDWLPTIWNSTRELGLSSHGAIRYDQCPKISADIRMSRLAAGLYYAYDVYHGPRIKIGPLHHMRMYDMPMFDAVRDTILHEVQHAIDDRHGFYSVNHSHWFYQRLDKLTTLFPTSSLL